MIKSILTILRYSVVILLGIGFLTALLTFLASLDYTLIAYAMNILTYFNNIRFDTLFNYPNVLLLMGYFLFKEMLMLMIRFIKERVKTNE